MKLMHHRHAVHALTRALTRALTASALVAAAATSTTTAAEPTDAYRLYIDAHARGRIDAAAALFTDDAVVTIGPLCSPTVPCVGRKMIRERYLAAVVPAGTPPPIRDQFYDGQRLRTRGEAVMLVGPDRTVRQLRGGHVFELRGGRIAAIHFELDAGDEETAHYLRSLAPAVSALVGGERR